ncbi:unnamed protein product [Somion occarium]|uniref:Peptide hydrolase n=1 Tax=Somion occarium TaxID=3059160 RepID=A0ABP1CQB7_9APHY
MLILPAASLVYLIVGGGDLFNTARHSCLSDFYYGTYGQENVFIASQGPRPWDDSLLIWLNRVAVDNSIASQFDHAELTDFFGGLVASAESQEAAGQQVFGVEEAHPDIVVDSPYMKPNNAFLKLSPRLLPKFEEILPRFWKYTILPETPFSMIPVPEPAVDRVRKILDSVKFNPVVASLVNNISVPQMQQDIRFLTGEDPKSEIVTRHSFSDGIKIAANWIKGVIDGTGASCELKPFLPGFGPNIVCSYTPTVETNETILLSAHYDSRGSFGNVRAPGGDDDGSGTTAIIAIARTVARKGVSFKKNVQLCLFAGEEQGLYGSRAYARELRAQNANLTLMIQADMLAYHVPGEPPQLGLPDLIGTTEVTQLVANLSAIYSPELKVGFTPACCSDHQSFHEQGFPASQVFERAGPIADPMYHNSGDLSDRPGYDLEQVKSIAKVQFATLLHSAGFELPESDD